MIYYGLLSGLPTLQIGKEALPEINDLKELVKQYADANDHILLELFFYQIDLVNYNAIIQNKHLWMPGGHLDQKEVERWANTGELDQYPFNELEPILDADQLNPLERLQDLWQTLYNALHIHANQNIRRLIDFEISYKNFLKGYLERELTESPSGYYLEGGWFDRFDYRKLLVADIQAEHPYLAKVLQNIENKDPYEREYKILEAKWQFFDYVSFFERFSIEGLFAWLIKYLDVYKWSFNDREKGVRNLDDFHQNIYEQIQAQY